MDWPPGLSWLAKKKMIYICSWAAFILEEMIEKCTLNIIETDKKSLWSSNPNETMTTVYFSLHSLLMHLSTHMWVPLWWTLGAWMQPPFDAGDTKEASDHQTEKKTSRQRGSELFFGKPCHVACTHTNTHTHTVTVTQRHSWSWSDMRPATGSQVAT